MDSVAVSWTLNELIFTLQVDHGNTLPIVIPTAAKDVVIEVQTPINKRALTKALTPPVSIKNFFTVKPKSTISVTEVDVKPDAVSSADLPPSDDKTKKDNTSGKTKPVQVKLWDSFTATPPATSRGCPTVIEDGVSGQCSSNEHSLGQRKRRLPGGTNSLIKMFKHSESLSAKTCPVCGLKIDAISNSAINLHIDKCLASSAAQT